MIVGIYKLSGRIEVFSLKEKRQIIKATLAALIIGVGVFVIAILPAEYGSDPLGTGKLLGLN